MTAIVATSWPGPKHQGRAEEPSPPPSPPLPSLAPFALAALAPPFPLSLTRLRLEKKSGKCTNTKQGGNGGKYESGDMLSRDCLYVYIHGYKYREQIEGGGAKWACVRPAACPQRGGSPRTVQLHQPLHPRLQPSPGRGWGGGGLGWVRGGSGGGGEGGLGGGG